MKSKMRFSAGALLMFSGSAFATSINIPVPDGSFETPSTPDGTSVNISDSTIPGAWTSNLFCYIDNPVGNGVGTTGETWSTPVPDGDQVLHLAAAGDPYGVQVDQVIPNTFVAGQTYTFSVWAGSDWGNVGLPMHYAIRMFGETGSVTKYMMLATHLTNPVAPGQWSDVTGTYTVAPNDTLIGNGAIELNLTNGQGYDTTNGQGDVFFDDVQVSVVNPFTWNNAGGSGDGATWDASNQNWHDGANPAVYADGTNVTFNDTNNGHYAVTLNSIVNPGSVVVNNSAGNYVISGTGKIAGSGSLMKMGSSSLTLSTVNTYSGGTTVGAGTLIAGVAGALPDGAVTINGTGTLQLGANTGLTQLTSLLISDSGKLDLNNNHLIISYSGVSPIGEIAAYIATGYAGGAWNGTGIMSTAAQANSGSYGIGYADSADPGNPAGLASGTIEIKYTLLGDANLDGAVNGSDFAILATNFNKAVSGWDQGDFNYDGAANGSDFALLAANFNKGSNGAVTGGDLNAFAANNGLLADVPEPASAGIMMIGAVFAFHFQRRMRRTTSA